MTDDATPDSIFDLALAEPAIEIQRSYSGLRVNQQNNFNQNASNSWSEPRKPRNVLNSLS